MSTANADTNALRNAPALKKLGRYEIIAELGRGAMGTVYHGVDATIERPVALKTLNPELPGEILAEVKERFLREAKSAGRLNHPNIVTIYEFGEDAGTAFIAMEFLEGKSLQDVMRGGRLPFTTIADIVAQIADALDYANRFGVVHRDIKPANIMIAPHGAAKLTDFGIARVQSSSMTQTGAMLGSPKYMSPEQVLGQQADGRADIFSLGVVLYEMLSGCTPFETPDSTVFSLMQRIVTEPHRSIMEAANGTPPEFEQMLLRALAKKPDQRYQRAAEFAAELRGLLPALGGAPGGAPASATIVAASASAAAAAEMSYERTVVTKPGGAGLADPAFAVTMASTPPAVAPVFLADFDLLGTSLDEMQQKAADDEAKAMSELRQNASRSKDWGAMASGLSAAQAPAPSSIEAASITRKSGGVFDLLQQQSGATLKEQAVAKTQENQTAALAFDEKMRACYAFLSEFFRAANAANPVYATQHSLPLFGTFPPLHFAEGVVNKRNKRIESGGKTVDVIEHLIVSYSLVAAERRRAAFHAPDLVRYKALLDEHEMKYKMTETRNAAGQVTHAGFDVEPRINCALTMRADITGNAVDIVCRNLGPLGRRQYRLRLAQLGDDVYEEISKMMLGHFSELLARHAAR